MVQMVQKVQTELTSRTVLTERMVLKVDMTAKEEIVTTEWELAKKLCEVLEMGGMWKAILLL